MLKIRQYLIIFSVILTFNLTILLNLSATNENSNTQSSNQNLSLLKPGNRLDKIEDQRLNKDKLLLEGKTRKDAQIHFFINSIEEQIRLLAIFFFLLSLGVLLAIVFLFRNSWKLKNLKKNIQLSLNTINKDFLAFKEESNNLLEKNISLFEKDFYSKVKALENSLKNLEATSSKSIRDLKFRNKIINKFLTTYKSNIETKLKDIKKTFRKTAPDFTYQDIKLKENSFFPIPSDSGSDYVSEEKLDSIISTLRKACELNIEITPDTFLKNSNLFLNNKRFEDALFLFQELERKMNISSEIYYAKACCLAFLDRKDNMLEELKNAISSNPVFKKLALEEEAFRKFRDDPIFLTIVNSEQ